MGEAAEREVGGWLRELGQKKWEVFIKPFDHPDAVYEYLSRYVHQVAMSNYRLEEISGGWVRFRYYDNQERGEVGKRAKKRS